MVQKSNFNHDLKQEQILGRYLDKIYETMDMEGTLRRVTSLDSQNAGVDLTYSSSSNNNGFIYSIDEKAQLTYLNKSLPTFAFELSYMLNGKQKKGWLFDANKTTYYYFLVTSIFLKNGLTKLSHESEISGCTLTKVHRNNLQSMLCNSKITNPDAEGFLNEFEGRVLTELTCEELSEKLRASEKGSTNSKSIKLNNYMKIFYTGWLAEKPINIVINLNYILHNSGKSSQKRYKTGKNGEIELLGEAK